MQITKDNYFDVLRDVYVVMEENRQQKLCNEYDEAIHFLEMTLDALRRWNLKGNKK